MTELTDADRAKILAYFEQHPRAGYKLAVRSLGGDHARVTQAEAKALILADDELVDARFKGFGLDQQSLYAAIGDIVGNADHKDRLNGVKFTLNVLYGVTDKERVEITGDSGGPLQIIVESAFPEDTHADDPSAVPGEPETS